MSWLAISFAVCGAWIVFSAGGGFAYAEMKGLKKRWALVRLLSGIWFIGLALYLVSDGFAGLR